MSRQYRVLLAGGALSCALSTGSARAQIDTNPPLNNVMLLVDTSGSMEYNVDGSKVTCALADSSLASTEPAPGTSQKSRWTQLVEVLTGDIDSYACYTQDRNSAAFANEYRLGGVGNIYDYQYYVPYHRPLSGNDATDFCTVGPGTAASNAFDWGSDPFHFHRWNNPSSACTTFRQASTGVLDSFRDLMRFGVMTFDSLPDPGTGLVSSTTTTDFASGTAGDWSYFPDWRTSLAAHAKGRPAGCSLDSDLEVGVRNSAAPPWEGRMIAFGPPDATASQFHTNNDHIQQEQLAVRPFGATPINGMMADVRDFLLNDTTADPFATGTQGCSSSNPGNCFGPKYDPYVAGGCRTTSLVLLTDGEPNLDLRPNCAEPTGNCPYTDKSDEIADKLLHPTDGSKPIKTYVVGFAVSTVNTGGPTPVDCTQISSASQFDTQGLCGTSMNPMLSACCALAKIAFFGGTVNAHFASNVNELRSALNEVLISGVPSTSRTLPVFASGPSTLDTFAATYEFLSAFSVPTTGLWSGILQRKRSVCDKLEAKEQLIDTGKGDDFAANLNSGNGPARQFFTVNAKPDGAGLVWSDRSIRPNIDASNPDKIGTIGGDLVQGIDSSFVTKVTEKEMRMTTGAPCAVTTVPPTVTPSAAVCANQVLQWEVGMANGSKPSRLGNEFGDIYHATPVVVSAPNEFVRDESYTDFTLRQSKRPLMLYTGTNDGQLHAFKVSTPDPTDSVKVDKLENNEVWSFFPPAVLPNLAAQYPSTHLVLLDGAPVVKDVIFSRTSANAQAGTAGTSGWRTVLVASFGAGGTGYYAVDITNPIPKTGDPTTGPIFLWQLTTDKDGNRLFGQRGGTPAITTLFFNSGGENKEIAVAILPGGSSGGPTGPSCKRNGLTPNELVDTTKLPRANVRCWGDDPARSLTIVRLDTGEIIRSFRATGTAALGLLDPARVLDNNKFSDIDSPITGQPVAYPAATGTVADRAFVGDEDGTLWRVDLSNTDPTKWTMKLWFDAFYANASNEGQPIATPPILSVDRTGNLTAAISTGDQASFLFTSGMKNYLWTLSEDPQTSTHSKALWYLPFNDGERVSGPISLFSSALYFSSFAPAASTNACVAGSSKIWGMHYTDKLLNAPDGSGGTPQLVDPDLTAPNNVVQSKNLGASLVFGVGITQQASCSSGEDPSSIDPYLGFGTHTSMPNLSPGNFQLVVQTGTGGKADPGARANTMTFTLQPPPSSTRIDSWAAILE